MGADSHITLSPRRVEVRLMAILAALGVFTVVVPYLAELLGFEVKVAASVEVVDHVVPGALVALGGLYLTTLARRRTLVGAQLALLAGGVCFLAGFWVLATHVPLLADAGGESVSWGAALWHSSTAVPIVVLALWCVLRSSQAVPNR